MDENLSDAIGMLFSILVFVIAISSTMFLFSKLQETGIAMYNSQTTTIDSGAEFSGNVIDMDATVYALQNLYDSSKINEIEGELKKFNKRIVNKTDIAAMLLRYSKESFSVQIFDEKMSLKQVFDSGLEKKVENISILSKKKQEETFSKSSYDKLIYNTYGNPDNQLFLFNAPWEASDTSLVTQENSKDAKLSQMKAIKEENENISKKDRYIKDRVNLYISGAKGYINGIMVDYSTKGRDWFSKLSDGDLFDEYIVKYNTSGNVTLAATEGENYGTDLINGEEPTEKIEIIYIKRVKE